MYWLFCTWFSLARSRLSQTFLLFLGTRTKLLHSDNSSTPSGTIINCFDSLPISSLKGYYSAYAICLGGISYGLLPSLICKVNLPLKHPLPVNTASNSLHNLFVGLSLACSSAILLEPCRK